MELKNYMEIMVMQTLDELLKNDKNVCGCDKCKLDMAAIALNSLPPKYIVNHNGEIYTRVSMLDNQATTDVLSAVMKSIMRVGANPRH